MAKKSKFKLDNGKSTGYVLVYYVAEKGWRLIRDLTKDKAKEIMKGAPNCVGVHEVMILHIEDSWQRRFFDDETV